MRASRLFRYPPAGISLMESDMNIQEFADAYRVKIKGKSDVIRGSHGEIVPDPTYGGVLPSGLSSSPGTPR